MPESTVTVTVTATATAGSASARWCVLGRTAAGGWAIVDIAADGTRAEPEQIAAEQLAAGIARRERGGSPRWVWHDTAACYGPLLDAGVRVERCHDLRLCHQILRHADSVRDAADVRAARRWDAPPEAETAGAPPAPEAAPALFDWVA